MNTNIAYLEQTGWGMQLAKLPPTKYKKLVVLPSEFNSLAATYGSGCVRVYLDDNNTNFITIVSICPIYTYHLITREDYKILLANTPYLTWLAHRRQVIQAVEAIPSKEWEQMLLEHVKQQAQCN